MKALEEIYLDVIRDDARLSDKGRGECPHLDLYDTFLAEYREKATSIFEIGVNYGGSISMWQEFFPNATIYGLDVKSWPLDRIKHLDRVIPIKLDQGDSVQLSEFASNGPFDVGIDDGSHIWSHQILTFEKLWPSIRAGGIYVVEDVLTSYQWYLDGVKSTHTDYAQGPITAVEYFKSLIDDLNESHVLGVDWILFRMNSIVVKKRA